MTNLPKPNLVFDHIAIVARTLEEGAEYVRDQLGIDMPMGGKHPFMGTHNLLLSLGETEFLEVIAIDPDAPKPDHPRWFDLDQFDGSPRIGTWLLGTNDIEAYLSKLHGPAIEMTRGELWWLFSAREDGTLPIDGALPTLIEWPEGPHPAGRMEGRGCMLKSFEIFYPKASTINGFLDDHFNDPRITASKGEQAFKAVFETPSGLRTLT